MSALSTLLTEFRVTVVPEPFCAGVRSFTTQRLPTISMPPSMISGRYFPSDWVPGWTTTSSSVCVMPSSHTRTLRARVRSGEPNWTLRLSEIGMR